MQLSGFKLLIVEDDEINRFVLEKLLRTTGCEFALAGSGEEALVKFQNGRFDVILLDIELPGMNGYQTALEIRNSEGLHCKQPRILAMTSHHKQDNPENGIPCGIDGWIVKPFGMDQLEMAIRKSLKERESPAEKTETVINLELLNSIAGDDPDFLQVCIELFLREMPENLIRLNSAIEICDWETIRTTSHKMKTSLNYMGLNQERLAALSIEHLARDKRELGKIKSDAKLITFGCQRAFGELQQILTKH